MRGVRLRIIARNRSTPFDRFVGEHVAAGKSSDKMTHKMYLGGRKRTETAQLNEKDQFKWANFRAKFRISDTNCVQFTRCVAKNAVPKADVKYFTQPRRTITMLNDGGMPLRSVENLPNYLGRSVRYLFSAFSRHQNPIKYKL